MSWTSFDFNATRHVHVERFNARTLSPINHVNWDNLKLLGVSKSRELLTCHVSIFRCFSFHVGAYMDISHRCLFHVRYCVVVDVAVGLRRQPDHRQSGTRCKLGRSLAWPLPSRHERQLPTKRPATAGSPNLPGKLPLRACRGRRVQELLITMQFSPRFFFEASSASLVPQLIVLAQSRCSIQMDPDVHKLLMLLML